MTESFVDGRRSRRVARYLAKVIPMPPPRLRRQREFRIGTAIVVVGLMGATSTRMHVLRTVTDRA